MSAVLNTLKAELKSLSLAKVGNKQQGGILRTSKDLCSFEGVDREVLRLAFLRPFKKLEPYYFYHKSELNLHEMHSYAATIFDQPDRFLANSRRIARHLYECGKHPKIKDGDLCVAYLENVQWGAEVCSAVSIVKSESSTPFLEISDRDGDLALSTHEGIYPEKIDKGCLILDLEREDGFVVFTFDKGGADAQFWVRDFLAAKIRKDDDYQTRKYSEMCVQFANEGLGEEVSKEQKHQVMRDAMDYFTEKDAFSEKHFQEEVLKDPQVAEKFQEYRAAYRDEDGEELAAEFAINPQVAKREVGKFRSVMKLDTGVEIRLRKEFSEEEQKLIEHGVDEARGMKFVKVYYHEDVSV